VRAARGRRPNLHIREHPPSQVQNVAHSLTVRQCVCGPHVVLLSYEPTFPFCNQHHRRPPTHRYSHPCLRLNGSCTRRQRHYAQAIPTIALAGGGDEDSDGGSSSDGELPIFYTTTEADADCGPTPLYRAPLHNTTPVRTPADVPPTRTAPHAAASDCLPIVYPPTSTAPRAAATAPPVAAAVGDDELAAFERAAAEALLREEQRSGRLVAEHLTGTNSGLDSDGDRDDGNGSTDDDDGNTDVRARRRPTSRTSLYPRQPNRQPQVYTLALNHEPLTLNLKSSTLNPRF